MDVVLLKQKKPQQAIILGCMLLILVPVLWYFNENTINKIIIVFLAGFVLVGYSFTYEIRKEYDNYRKFNLFGFTIWKQKMNILYPDYISIFSTSFKKDNDWGPVAALGTQSKDRDIVVKFFKGSNNEIVYKSNEYSKALEKANELSALLNVRVHDATKNSST